MVHKPMPLGHLITFRLNLIEEFDVLSEKVMNFNNDYLFCYFMVHEYAKLCFFWYSIVFVADNLV